MPTVGGDTFYQDQILGQVEELNKQLTKLDGAEQKLNSKKRGKKGKKGRGKKGRAGSKAQEIENQKAKLEAIRNRLQKKLKAQEQQVAEAARKQEQMKQDLADTE